MTWNLEKCRSVRALYRMARLGLRFLKGRCVPALASRDRRKLGAAVHSLNSGVVSEPHE